MGLDMFAWRVKAEDAIGNFEIAKEEDGSGFGGGTQTDANKSEITSHTEKHYRENEKKLFAENAKERVYANIPKVDLNEAIMDYKEVYRRWKIETESRLEMNLETETDQYLKIRNNSNKTVIIIKYVLAIKKRIITYCTIIKIKLNFISNDINHIKTK